MTFIHYSASIEDARGQRKVVDAYLNQASLANEPGDFYAWLAGVDGVINGVIVAGQIRVTPVLPTTLSGTARTNFADSRVEEVGELRFNLAGSPKHWTQAIPAWSDAMLNTSKAPDLSATAVVAYLTIMTSAGGLTGASFTDNTGLGQLTTLFQAFIGNRKAKGLRAKTLVTP